ncbi:putative ATP:guanido phosphotransferase Clo1313_2463 [Clostridium sp. CAG:798]|jgi:protein arginine kinase|nr:putative ATP:guanido phosphotransferase Clo1313_2463 [Clostridium sp. CAG:798]
MANWYLQNGKDSDVVISSRVRLARNLADFPFKDKAKQEDLEQILKKIKEIVPSIGYGLKYIELRNIDNITKLTLIENHLISPEFATNKKGAILINDEENICIMINEEDHIRIQVFSSGQELEELLNLAIEIDEKIDGLVTYATNERYGYLTSCPTNVGTGLRASVMVHLPALTLTGNIEKVLNVVNNFGMNIRGVYGEGTQSKGNIYQISNNQSLGLIEKEIIKNIKTITEKVIEQERLARKYLTKRQIDLEDRVYRAYGILANAMKLSSEECRKLLSDVKLGTDLGIIKELDDMKVSKLETYTKPGNLQKYLAKELDAYDRDIERSKVVKQILNN